MTKTVGDTGLTPTQMAYGILWRSIGDNPDVHAARRLLYSALSKEEQRAAIEWVIKDKGAPTLNQMIGIDYQLGIFPKQSYEYPPSPPSETPHEGCGADTPSLALEKQDGR